MGFWDNERCEYCKGRIIEKTIDLPRKAGKKYILIKKIPTGVCTGCGTRYFAANVLKNIKMILQGRKKAKSRISMAVYSL